MAKKSDKIAFGTSFRGYRKADVNDFIERKASDFAKKEEEFNSLLRQKDEKINEALAENARLAEILAESDKVIMEQKATIDEQTELIEELKASLSEKDEAFDALNAEVEQMSEKIALLALEQEKKTETPKEKKEPLKVKPAKKDDADSVANALKVIKNKILSFLK